MFARNVAAASCHCLFLDCSSSIARVCVCVGGGGGGGGAGGMVVDGSNLGVILVRMCEPVFQNLPHSYTWPLKKRTHSYP